jgi:outer membrane protein
MNKTFGLTALALALAAPGAFAQDTGHWLIRGRALNLQSANGGSTNPNLKLSINDKTFPEVDFSYFYTPNFAVELVLTYPQKHDLRSDGKNIGTLKHLPPSVLAQYHFTGASGFRPYVGAGVNYTIFSDVSFDPAVDAALHPSIKKSSTGLALQVGVDIPVGGGWLVNLDAKKLQLKTDVKSSGTTIGSLKVDPTLLSLGVGLRF